MVKIGQWEGRNCKAKTKQFAWLASIKISINRTESMGNKSSFIAIYHGHGVEPNKWCEISCQPFTTFSAHIVIHILSPYYILYNEVTLEQDKTTIYFLIHSTSRIKCFPVVVVFILFACHGLMHQFIFICFTHYARLPNVAVVSDCKGVDSCCSGLWWRQRSCT